MKFGETRAGMEFISGHLLASSGCFGGSPGQDACRRPRPSTFKYKISFLDLPLEIDILSTARFCVLLAESAFSMVASSDTSEQGQSKSAYNRKR